MRDKKTVGILLGLMVLTIGMWFFSLLIVGYVKGDINPFNWDWYERAAHLGLQAVFVTAWLAVSYRFRRG